VSLKIFDFLPRLLGLSSAGAVCATLLSLPEALLSLFVALVSG
jgi:hypothetical protein